MDYSNFIILLARQRSGTNALRSILKSHPDIFCLNEVFNLIDKDSEYSLLRETNFFTFLIKCSQGDISRIFPNNHERLFLDFLEYLKCFSSKRYILIDVKLNTTHFLTQPTQDIGVPPYLFKLIVTYGLKIFNLTRKNYLRYVVSLLKAQKTGYYTVNMSDTSYLDNKIQINVSFLLHEINKCYAEDQLINKYFASYAQYLPYDYADVFPQAGSRAADDFLQCFSQWLGISNCFEEVKHFKKQSYLSLEETIENFEEVTKALRRTKFEYCLEDERMYGNS